MTQDHKNETVKHPDGEAQSGYELVYGKNPVLEVIENSNLQVNKIWLSDSLSDHNLRKRIVSFAQEKKIPYFISPNKKLSNLTNNQNHQGLVLSISPIKYLSVTEVIEHTNKNKSKAILVAHEIEDPHNLGAMIRTFVAGSGTGVILTGRHNVSVNSTIIKTSSGALFQTQFARASNCVNVLNELKENDFWIVGTDISEELKTIYETDFPDKIAILIGNEHEGLGQLIKKNCDFLLRIPISNKIDSLNASVAFGIVLFEYLRQKQFKSL